MERKDLFFQTYANLPINVRKEIVLSIDPHGPITWEVAYREIKADTDLGKIILQKLFDLQFIKTDNVK
ncbi:MAG: hypothetical protein ABSE18_00930 [Minisyncoccia bacterium]|jgi:hypothetical protein